MARYECLGCHQSVVVPFSCKTRLFCPSCHEAKVLIWIEDIKTMTELFRFELIEAMFKAGVLTAEVANNLFSWKHSGFHVHASEAFMPPEGDKLRNRLAYAFRPAVALGKLSFDGETVICQTKKTRLTLTPMEFLAKLTLHIPDRYQNIRRYAGNIQRLVRGAARDQSLPLSVEVRKPVKPKWATLIAKIFRDMPTICPKCSTAMDLKEFILDEKIILKVLPQTARAPPQKRFEPYPVDYSFHTYGLFDDATNGDAGFDQAREYDDSYFNQDINW